MNDINKQFLHNLIKIKYIREGYLPDVPYHLISDIEMLDAFLRVSFPKVMFQTEEHALDWFLSGKHDLVHYTITKNNQTWVGYRLRHTKDVVGGVETDAKYWGDANGDGVITQQDLETINNYLINFDSSQPYDPESSVTYGLGPYSQPDPYFSLLIDPNCYFLQTYMNEEDITFSEQDVDEQNKEKKTVIRLLFSLIEYVVRYRLGLIDSIPRWVYSYMLGEVIGPNSKYLDIYDMKQLMGLDDISEDITSEFKQKCIEISEYNMTKNVDDGYCPTIFCDIFTERYLRSLSE